MSQKECAYFRTLPRMTHKRANERYRYVYAKLLRLYPTSYRERFGQGMEQTFNDLCREREAAGGRLFGPVSWIFVETVGWIVKENLVRAPGAMGVIAKKPSAWLPVALSFGALTFVLVYVALFGIVRTEDEGTPAHIFQLLMVLQALIVAVFAIKWLPRAPKQAAIVLMLQVVIAVVPIATIVLLGM